MRIAIALALLLLPAVAHAKTGMSGETIGQIAVALLTIVGGSGGLVWYRRHQQGAEGREQLSTRAQVAIARDNNEKILREQIDAYRAEVASLREELQGSTLQARASVEQISLLREEVLAHQQRAERRKELAAMLAAVNRSNERLARQLELALADIARRAGDYRANR